MSIYRVGASVFLTLALSGELCGQVNEPARPGVLVPHVQSTIPTRLSLADAERMALQNHPSISSAMASSAAVENTVSEARSALFPTVNINATSTLADDGTVLAAGALQTSSLNSRFATGVSLLQLITDFGRTRSLAKAARFRYQAANDNVINARARILLTVRSAYFSVFAADAVLRAARATLSSRQLLLRQISFLAQSSLRSTLDVTFAQVVVSEAQLAVDQAENDAHSSRAVLATALALPSTENISLEDPPEAGALPSSIDSLIASALRDRPDLNLLEHEREAAFQNALAEKRLSYPVVTLQGVAGAIPEHDHTLVRDHYDAAGVNVSIPVFNGGLFAARRAEAEARAAAAGKDVQTLQLDIEREVRTAWYNADNAFRRLSVTAQLVEQARRAVHLAEARYNAGLGSIVELTQAQTSQISAEISAAAARYDYLSRLTDLDFSTGALH